MGLPKSPSMYRDVKEVLDAAVAAGGARYTLPDAKAATRWRARAHYYRTLLRKSIEGSLLLATGAKTPYDDLIIGLEGNVVVITIRAPDGVITKLDGSPLTPAPEVEKEIEGLDALRARILGGSK